MEIMYRIVNRVVAALATLVLVLVTLVVTPWHWSHLLIARVTWSIFGWCPHVLRFWNRCPALFPGKRTLENGRRYKTCCVCNVQIARIDDGCHPAL
jgi:hypothetical protein